MKATEAPKGQRIAKDFRAATVALLGRPNAGKSTLLNALLEVAVSATSARPQTTRRNVRGILQLKDSRKRWNGQLVLVDTPGVNLERGLLDRSMYMSIEGALDGVDVAVWVSDAKDFARDLRNLESDRAGDDKIAGWLRDAFKTSRKNGGSTAWVLALTKVDTIALNTLLPLMQKIAATLPEIEHIVPVAAIKGMESEDSNLPALLNVLRESAPSGDPLYPEDSWTDLTERDLVQQLVREAVFRQSYREVPYETDCAVMMFNEPDGEKKRRPEAEVVIWVSRSSLKPILVGKGGARIKEIGIAARERYKEVTGQDLILRLFVKVVEKWPLKAQAIGELGYEIRK